MNRPKPRQIILVLVAMGLLLFPIGLLHGRAHLPGGPPPDLKTVEKVYCRAEAFGSDRVLSQQLPRDFDGDWKPIRIHRLVPNEQLAVWLKLILPQGDWKYPELFLQVPVLDFEVYQVERSGGSGVLIYKSRDGVHEHAYQRSNLRAHFIPLTNASTGKIIYIRVHPNRFQYALPWGAIKIGERAAYIREIVGNELLYIIISCVLIFTGLCLLGFQLIAFKKYPPFVGISLYALCTGVHFFFVYVLTQISLDEPVIRYYMETLTYYLFPVGGILFVDAIVDSNLGWRSGKPVLKILLGFYTVHALLMFILDRNGWVPMWQTHKLFACGLVLTLVYLIFCIVRMARHVKMDLKIILWGGILAGFSDLHDMFGVLTGRLWLGQYISLWGMLIMVIAMILFMIANFAQSDRKLKELNQALEARVRSRTQELETANTELEDLNAELNAAVSNLEQAEIQLIQSEKMALLGQLISGIAHEINTPLGSIKSNMGMESVLIRGLATDETENYPAIIANIVALNQISLTALDRIGGLVKNLKKFARLEDNEQKLIDIHEGLESTLSILSHRIKGRIHVIKSYGDIPPIMGYPQQLNQVFLNILLNALQAIGGEGEIAIATCLADAMVQIRIKDSGPGIPAADLPRIFAQGFTTKESGTGLGLAICHEIIEKHHGLIRVQSEMGHGAKFIIELPIQGVKQTA